MTYLANHMLDRMKPMEPIELRARRAALGLEQRELAEMLACSPSVIEQWETGADEMSDPVSVDLVLQSAENLADELLDRLEGWVEHASGVLDSPYVDIRTYGSDSELWASDAWCAEHGVRASMHRTTAAWAARLVRDGGITARIIQKMETA